MRFFPRVLVLTCLLSITMSYSVRAQEDELDELLAGSADDAEKLIGAYIAPFMKSATLALNQGWYNTAKPHKIAGIDITITVNAMKIPSSEYFYDVASLNLQKIELDQSPAGVPAGSAPTFIGPKGAPVFRFKDNPSSTFNGPGGLDPKGEIGYDRVPIPMAHLGIGLPKSTDLKIRFIPQLEFDNTRVKLFGFGVMHDIKQWIPGIKLLPFDLSGFIAHTSFKVDSKLDPDTPGNEDQEAALKMSATTIQAIIGKKFSVLSVYGGIGYNIAKSNIALRGEYEIDEGDGGVEPIKDPINLDFAASGPRATVGARLKLAIFTFHADYTLQKYSCFTAGFGLSVR